MSTPKPPTPKGGGPIPGPPPKWRTRDGVALETATGLAATQTIGANFGTTGIIVAAGVTAGAAGGGWALRQFAPGIASRIGLRKPGTPRSPRGSGGGRSAGGRGLSSRVFGSRPGGRSGSGLRNTRGRRPGTPGGGSSGGRGRGRRPGTSRTSSGGGITSRLRQRGTRNHGYGRAPINSGGPIRRKARYDRKTGTWTTRSRNPFRRPSGSTSRTGRRPGTRNASGTTRGRTRAAGSRTRGTAGGKNTRRTSWFKPGSGKTNGKTGRKTTFWGSNSTRRGKKRGLFTNLLTPAKPTKPTKPGTPQPKPNSQKTKPNNTDKLTNATSSTSPRTRWQDTTTGGTPMTGRSRIVRPGRSGGGPTNGGVADPRLQGLYEAASAPIPEIDTAVELRGVLKGTAPTLEAVGEYFGRLGSVAQENVRVAPAFAEAMNQTKLALGLAAEAARETQESFDRIHAEQLEKIAHGDRRDEAWDVTKNRQHM